MSFRPANRPRPLSDFVPGLTKDVFGAQNMLFGKMLAHWAEIAGPDTAARTLPIALKFSATRTKKVSGARPEKARAVLHLAVQPSYALELTYQKALLVERLNVFFGYPAVSDIKTIQQSNITTNNKSRPARIRALDTTETNRISKMVEKIQETDLQTALENLGKAILSRM